jgi:hypothetical protein
MKVSDLAISLPHAQIEPRFSFVTMGPQPDYPAHDASATDLHYYKKPHGTRGRSNSTTDQRKRTRGRRARPVCVHCNKDFGRIQELKRHLIEKHAPPRRCPFCDVPWTRPSGMKAHLMARHAEKFTAEMLEAIKALRGRRFIEFIDAYDYCPDLDIGTRSM